MAAVVVDVTRPYESWRVSFRQVSMGEAGWASRFVGGRVTVLALAAVLSSRGLSGPKVSAS